MRNLKTLFFLAFTLCITSATYAFNPPPVNDTVCDATDLGLLPVPGSCLSYPYGDTIQVQGTTEWATYNTFDFSPVHCFPSGAPDVWYRFRSTGSYLYIEANGFQDLDSFFVKIHSSLGTCLSLVPLDCEITTNGTLQASFRTPEIGGEYFLQIGGSTYDEAGPFQFIIKSFNECSDCVRNATVELSPSPWFGRYGVRDTVKMCVTVDRWNAFTFSDIHGIVPQFGADWDIASLTPVSAPGPTSQGWGWFTNVSTPSGPASGYFFDANLNGNPSDNTGQSGNITDSWQACWKIAVNPFCNTYDLGVDVMVYGDAETGSGTQVGACQDVLPIHLGLSSWCCPSPAVSTVSITCSTAVVTINPVETAPTDTFDLVIYDSQMQFVSMLPSVLGPGTAMTTLLSGQYIIECNNVSNGCVSFAVVDVPAGFEIFMDQTSIGCGSGSGVVVATTNSLYQPVTWDYPDISGSDQTDSIAFNLVDGFLIVEATDAIGCLVVDSIYVFSIDTPAVEFGYDDVSYCHNTDTIQVYFDPISAGGVYSLVAPLSVGISVDPATGIISLNNNSLTPPYYVKVKYTVGSICSASWTDSVLIVQQPLVPIPVGNAALDYCIGNPAPVLQIQNSGGIPLWYDAQTTQTGLGFSFSTPLNSSTTPGLYSYGVSTFADLTFGCGSAPLIFQVNAVNTPSILVSPVPPICEGDTADLVAISGCTGCTYNWTPSPTLGPSNTSVTATSPSVSTTYTCTISDGTCVSTYSLTVVVNDQATCAGFTLYNGFTPNGDGKNDTWVIDGADQIWGVKVTIYNRWGEEVWRGFNYDNVNVVWDGKDSSGNALPVGTYYFTIYSFGGLREKGWVELSR